MMNGIKTKNVPQSYFDSMYGSVTDEQEEHDLELWLEWNKENIMV